MTAKSRILKDFPARLVERIPAKLVALCSNNNVRKLVIIKVSEHHPIILGKTDTYINELKHEP